MLWPAPLPHLRPLYASGRCADVQDLPVLRPGVSNPELIPARLLQRAKNICASLMSEQEIAAIRREVDEKLARLDACLASLDAVPE